MGGPVVLWALCLPSRSSPGPSIRCFSVAWPSKAWRRIGEFQYVSYFVSVTSKQSIQASFTEALATNATPLWWLASYNLTNVWDDEALDDQDLDGRLTWEEHIAGTIPTNGADFFAVTDVMPGASQGDHVVFWTSATGRLYRLDVATNLVGSPSWVNVVSNVSGTSFIMNYTNLNTTGRSTFYCARVRLS